MGLPPALGPSTVGPSPEDAALVLERYQQGSEGEGSGTVGSPAASLGLRNAPAPPLAQSWDEDDDYSGSRRRRAASLEAQGSSALSWTSAATPPNSALVPLGSLGPSGRRRPVVPSRSPPHQNSAISRSLSRGAM